MNDGREKNWKLRLRYGQLATPFKHYTLLADGEIFDIAKSGSAHLGPAIMGLKVWASSQDEAFELTTAIAVQVGFKVTGRIQLYDTDPEVPPGEKPHGYDINFTLYDEDA